MQRQIWAAFSSCVATALVVGCGGGGSAGDVLLNVSYDPTRELWTEVNEAFVAQYQKDTGKTLTISRSHGGSSSQARAIVDGLDADVATLAMWFDTQSLQKAGLIKEGWEDKFPNRSLPYYSTIVFVVRKGNPKAIKDWPDLVKPDVKIVTPNPKTGGNGKLSFLAALGSVIAGGGTPEQAEAYIKQLYRQVPVLDNGARAATTTFSQKNIGDVHLTWENEAILEVQDSKGAFELVYPPRSIRAEPHVAVVDAVVDRKGTRAAAEAYLKFVYTPAGQEIVAKHHYRPSDADVFKKHEKRFPKVELFPIAAIAADWNEAHQKFFADGALFDRVIKR